MTARREYGGAIAAGIAGAGLVLLTLREDWARVIYAAPSPLPSGLVSVSGQNLQPGAGGLALAALACLAAIIATRGLARRLAGLAMAGLGAWTGWLVSAPVHAAAVISAAAGQASSGEFAGGSLPGGNSAIGGGTGTGGGLPAIGAASHVVLATFPWRSGAVAGAVVVIAVGLVTAWRGPGWPVMSSRFDRPAAPGATSPAAISPAASGPEVTGPGASGPGVTGGVATGLAASGPGVTRPGVAARPGAVATARPDAVSGAGPSPGGPDASARRGASADEPAAPTDASVAGPADDQAPTGAAYREDDTAALWEALDRGVDLTDAPG